MALQWARVHGVAPGPLAPRPPMGGVGGPLDWRACTAWHPAHSLPRPPPPGGGVGGAAVVSRGGSNEPRDSACQCSQVAMSMAQKRAVLQAEADLFIANLVREARKKRGKLSRAEVRELTQNGMVEFIMQMGPPSHYEAAANALANAPNSSNGHSGS